MSPMSVTDHALLRWLERIHGIDVEGFRAELRAEVTASLAAYGVRRGREEGLFVIDNGTVITVLAPGQRVQHLPGRSGFGVPRLVSTDGAVR